MFRVFLRAQIDEIRNAIGLGSEFSIVERLLNKENRGAIMALDDADQLGHIVAVDGSAVERSSAEKLEYLINFRDAAQRMPAMLTALESSSDADTVASVLACLVQLFTIQEVFSTPLERRSVAPEIVALFELSMTSSLVPNVVKFLQPTTPPVILRDAAVILFFIAVGVRIASTPEDSLLHPRHSLFKRNLVYVGAVEALVNVARNATTDAVKESAIRALGAIALDDQACRDYVLATATHARPATAASAFSPAGFSPASFDPTLLVRQELDALARSAGLGHAELEQLFAMWGNELNAQITREQFAAGLRGVGINDPLVIEQSFAAFDDDGSGTIDFREFVTAMATMNRGSADDRLRLMFRSYDVDKSGFLDHDEVFAIYRTALLFSGLPRGDPQLENAQLSALVNEAFRRVDINGDGKLSFEEFKLAVESSVIMADCFVKTPFST